jgi:transposase
LGKVQIVALARKLLVIIYAMRKSDQPFNEQKFIERKHVSEQRRIKRMMTELSRLGYQVSLAA